MATKKSRQRKRLVLHQFDQFADQEHKPRLVSVHPIKPQQFRLRKVSPLTPAQQRAFDAFDEGRHLLLHGSAGTGKTWLSLYLTLEHLLHRNPEQNRILIVRSVVPTREMGFLPGDAREKVRVYEAPYHAICAELFGRGDAYDILKQKNLIEFVSTSFVRGLTLNDCHVIVDEFSNCSFHELDSVITRAGRNCRMIFSGDRQQSDLPREQERLGVAGFMDIIRRLEAFETIEFGREDIVRSGLVRDYIIARENQAQLSKGRR